MWEEAKEASDEAAKESRRNSATTDGHSESDGLEVCRNMLPKIATLE